MLKDGSSYGDVREHKTLREQVSKHDVIIPLAAIVGFPACDRDIHLATSVNFQQIQDIVDHLDRGQLLLFPNSCLLKFASLNPTLYISP